MSRSVWVLVRRSLLYKTLCLCLIDCFLKHLRSNFWHNRLANCTCLDLAETFPEVADNHWSKIILKSTCCWLGAKEAPCCGNGRTANLPLTSCQSYRFCHLALGAGSMQVGFVGLGAKLQTRSWEVEGKFLFKLYKHWSKCLQSLLYLFYSISSQFLGFLRVKGEAWNCEELWEVRWATTWLGIWPSAMDTSVWCGTAQKLRPHDSTTCCQVRHSCSQPKTPGPSTLQGVWLQCSGEAWAASHQSGWAWKTKTGLTLIVSKTGNLDWRIVFGLLSFHVLGANRKMNHDSGALATVFYCFLAHNLYFCCIFCACGCLFGVCTSFPYLPGKCLGGWIFPFFVLHHDCFGCSLHSQGCLLREPLTSIVGLIMEQVHDFDCIELSGKWAAFCGWILFVMHVLLVRKAPHYIWHLHASVCQVLIFCLPTSEEDEAIVEQASSSMVYRGTVVESTFLGTWTRVEESACSLTHRWLLIWPKMPA